jgi:hypothetical protein
MKTRLLLAYQLLIGVSDTSTGLLLIAAPTLTLRLMHLHALPYETLPFLSYIGAFVLSVGLACLYGAWLVPRADCRVKLEVVWLLTAISRGVVALFVTAQIASGALESGWIVVAISDGTFSLLQIVGLAQGWLSDVYA